MYQKLSQGICVLQLKIFNFEKMGRLNLRSEKAPNPYAVKNYQAGNKQHGRAFVNMAWW